MKKFFALSFLFSASFLLFSACQSDSDSTVNVNQTGSEASLKSITCKDLKTEEYRSQCEDRLSTVAGDILAEEVLSTYDLSRCDTLNEDKRQYCKTYLQESGIQGPIDLNEIETLKLALQPVYPSLAANNNASVNGEQAQEIEPEYKKESCQKVSAEKGLRAYCEAQIQEKIEFNQLKKNLLSGAELNCQSFTRPRVTEECENVKANLN